MSPAGLPAGLPAGFVVRLGAGTRTRGGLLVGASGTVLRLRPRARRLLDPAGQVVVRDPDSRTLARALLDRGLADPCWPSPSAGDPVPGAACEVTVVVPVRDRPGQLARLLAGVSGLAGLAVVVVDDGSTDPRPTRAVAEEFGARLLRNERPAGPAAARNRGLAAARTPLVAFLDSDVVPVPGWLEVLRRHLDDPAVAVVGPRVLGGEPCADDSWLCRYEAARSSLDLGPRPGPVHPLARVAYLPSAALLVRRSACPTFDERMRVAEDVDLVWRLHHAGWRVRYEPAAVVRHDHRTALLPWLRRKAYYGTGAAPLADRHGSDVAPMVLTPWTAALTVCVLAQRRWSLPVAALLGAGVTGHLSRRVGSVRTAARLTTMAAAGTLLPALSVARVAWCAASASPCPRRNSTGRATRR